VAAPSPTLWEWGLGGGGSHGTLYGVTLPLFDLSSPARYFPIRNGRYDVTPGLFPLAQSFGNGAMDGQLFQIDREWSRYRTNKDICRAERFNKYVCYDDFATPVFVTACRLIADRLVTEHPDLFAIEMQSDGSSILSCRLTGETLAFDPAGHLQPGSAPGYADMFDALCCQIQEDIAIVRRTPERGDWICALHLCAPSHWAAEDKVGRNFTVTHGPVPGFEKVAAAAAALTEAILTRGPFVRFTWGIAFDNRLNCHPDEPRGVFDPATVHFRMERQTLYRLPDVEAYLFAIRVYVYPLREIRSGEAQRDALISALLSMSPESRRYKSLETSFDDVLAFLSDT
jgi:dimethylamine monooxygenase subunit A